MRMKLIVISVILILCYTPLVSTQTLTSSNYSIIRPRIAVFGGNALSSNYSLNNEEIGNPFGGTITSTNYTLDASTLNKPPENIDKIAPVIVITTPKEGTITCGRFITVKGTIDEEPFSEEKELSFGINSVTIDASDNAGNTSFKTIEVYRARLPLVLPL